MGCLIHGIFNTWFGKAQIGHGIFNTWFGQAQIGHGIFNAWFCTAWPAPFRASFAALVIYVQGGRAPL